MTVTGPPHAIGERLTAAILARDAAGMRGCIAPDAVIWTNIGPEQDRETFVAICDALVAAISDVRYANLRRADTATGFVQQHELTGTSPAGARFTVKACVVATVEDGRIVRFEEYIDAGQASGIGL
jgi:ketosteroid isomerase-like protein